MIPPDFAVQVKTIYTFQVEAEDSEVAADAAVLLALPVSS